MNQKTISSLMIKKIRLDFTTRMVLFCFYGILIILGFLGNLSLILAFFLQKVQPTTMKASMTGVNSNSFQVHLTTRNIFIVNLALSNLFLCTFTMPLTLADLTTKFWPLGANMVSFHPDGAECYK